MKVTRTYVSPQHHNWLPHTYTNLPVVNHRIIRLRMNPQASIDAPSGCWIQRKLRASRDKKNPGRSSVCAERFIEHFEVILIDFSFCLVPVWQIKTCSKDLSLKPNMKAVTDMTFDHIVLNIVCSCLFIFKMHKIYNISIINLTYYCLTGMEAQKSRGGWGVVLQCSLFLDS